MNVLSAFDGMSCGQIALNRLGVKVDKYFASEIDKFAIKGTQINFPDTIQLGSIVDVRGADLPKIDLFLAGSPCQGFSNSGKGLNFEDPRSKLFFDFVRVLGELRQVNPDIKFLLENVRMKKEWEDTISRILGIQPVCINSALVCAQNRERLYWTNIAMSQRGLFDDKYCTIPQPKDRNIFLKDILQPTCEVEEKYYISEKALARITRKTYSKPKVDPDKGGPVNTKNQSGQVSFDSGSTFITEPRQFGCNTLITERGKSHSVQVEGSGKVPSLTSRSGCEHDNRVVVGCISNNGEVTELKDGKSLCIDANYLKGADNHGQRTMVREPGIVDIFTITDLKGNQKPDVSKSSTFTAGANSAGHHSDMDLLVHRQMIQIPHGFNEGGEVAKDGKCPSITTSSWEQNNLLVESSIEVINTFPRSSTSGEGGTGQLKRNDGKTYCVDTQQNQVIKVPQADRIYDTEEKSVTLGARQGGGGAGAGTGLYSVRERIRRLTPLEVCRLQTVPDDHFFKDGVQVLSDSQIYKQCGNGWTVDAICHILSYLDK